MFRHSFGRALKLSIPENLWSQIGNVCLRALTLFSKFFLMFVVARFLEPADLGNYGLVSASVSFALYAVGLDFYTFTTREVLGRDRASWGGLLKSQAAMSGWLYSALLCVLLIVGATMALDLKMVFWFLCLLFIEHLNQELGRLLIAVQRPNTYGIVLFVRSGAWALPLAFLMYLFSGSRTLDFIFGFWAVSGIFAAIISALVLRRLGIRGFNQAVDWAWVRAGLKVALPLLAGTLAIRAVFTVDRYLVKAISDAATLGAYVLLFGIANVLTAFLDSGVFSFISPKLILASKENKKLVFFSLLGNLALQTFLISAFFLMIALLCIHPLLDIVGKPFYLSKLPMFTWLLVGSIIYALSMVPHYLLYALGNDRGIVASHVVAPIVFVLAVTLFGQIDADLVVPVGMCIAFLVMCVMKIYFAMRALIARGWLALS